MSPEWVADALGPFLLTQAVVGIGAAITLAITFKRFIGSEFPAFRKDVKDDFARVHELMRIFNERFTAAQLTQAAHAERLASHGERLRNLEARQERLDETHGGGPPRRPRRDA